ncbi:SRPBCC domain-containing protein [Streptomyces nodosus]|uniref:Carbon monoxide dehydrogenase n=1 Tax=Streptomyces nodosus TaxID=40318 RepID=A0A5P2VZF9_9ACTN|nr:SRPBCC domain-containing protein [Streptomyces nodosus]MBB4789586.1 carbon monoxide dehydrogenase subunit G [Streptomyces nodosus]QEV37396.1 carbon monoxide dehydrogenase [Streptomyces nodosus]
MISIAEKIDVPSPPARVWETISDPSAVVSCIGGAELGESHDDGSFDGVLVVRFGGIRVRFAARITLELDQDEREGRLTARGRDGQGATRFSGGAVFRVSENPATDGTQVAMTGEMNLSGKLAPLIESGAGVVVSRMTREFSAALVERCALPDATASESTTDESDAVAVPDDTAAPAVRPGWWRRVRDRLARLFGRGRSRPPADAASAGTSAPAPFRGGRP